MDDIRLADELEAIMTGLGATFIACADLRNLPAEIRSGLPVGILIGRALDPQIVAGIEHGPTPEYATEYTRVNELLEMLAGRCAAFLREREYLSQAGKPSMFVSDRGALATELPHKTVATLAGVGWIGKCALLISRRWGSALRFNTVLTDAPLPTGDPVIRSWCGDCDFCVSACPAGAALGSQWRQGMEREEFFDASACRDCASRLGLAAGSRRTICGICIAACPHTGAYLIRSKIAGK